MEKEIISIVKNQENLYEGDLKHYFAIIFSSKNVSNPYHNFGHSIWVTTQTYNGAKHVKFGEQYSKKQFRSLLIAAMFHDFNHTGIMKKDSEQIALAVKGIEENILPEDRPLLPEIIRYISSTEFPHSNKISVDDGVKIIRDADTSQCFNVVWLQHVIFGIAKELGMETISFLKSEIDFLKNLKFQTEWANENFNENTFQERINEVEELLDILS